MLVIVLHESRVPAEVSGFVCLLGLVIALVEALLLTVYSLHSLLKLPVKLKKLYHQFPLLSYKDW